MRKPCQQLSVDFSVWGAVTGSKSFEDTRQFFSALVYIYYQFDYIALQGMFWSKKSSARVKALTVDFGQLDVHLYCKPSSDENTTRGFFYIIYKIFYLTYLLSYLCGEREKEVFSLVVFFVAEMSHTVIEENFPWRGCGHGLKVQAFQVYWTTF